MYTYNIFKKLRREIKNEKISTLHVFSCSYFLLHIEHFCCTLKLHIISDGRTGNTCSDDHCQRDWNIYTYTCRRTSRYSVTVNGLSGIILAAHFHMGSLKMNGLLFMILQVHLTVLQQQELFPHRYRIQLLLLYLQEECMSMFILLPIRAVRSEVR